MRMPKSLKIGAHVYSVVYPHEFTERSDIDGHTWASLGLIRVSDRTAGGAKHTESYDQKVLLHELLHAIDNVFCGEILSGLGGEKEELIIEGMAQGLLAVITDNPEFMDCFRVGVQDTEKEEE